MFVEKLNKKQEGVYVIEEEKTITDGKWEGFLDHDNVNHQTIYIYTGPKLTGEKVENYFISTPSETPWKTHLKVFSESEKIYITYESKGDQVEAEDINLAQNAITNTINDLNEYKDSNNIEVDNLKNRTTTLEENKAEKTYVDMELLKKADKANTYTKDETDDRIQVIIGAAPEALDTLAEIAEALNNDPDFAATITNELAKKIDKVAGKGLSDENYTLAEKSKLAEIETGANKYIHPATHSAEMIIDTSSKRFVSDVEKAEWNSKETPEGAQTKANKAETNAKSYANSIKPTKVSELENDKNYVTQEDLGDAGYGDMQKSTYDTNNNGKVDIAELADKVPWNGVTNKPSTFTPSSHTHSISNVTGLQNALDNKMEKGPVTWNDLKGV